MGSDIFRKGKGPGGKDKIADAKISGQGNYIPSDNTNVHSAKNVIATFDVEIMDVKLDTMQNGATFLAVHFKVLGCSAPEFIKVGAEHDWFTDNTKLPFYANCKGWALAVMQGLGGDGVTEADIDSDVLAALTGTAEKPEDNQNLKGHRLRMRTYAKKTKEQKDPTKVNYFLGTQWSPASQVTTAASDEAGDSAANK
jgi:hypothetical protein